MIRKTPFARVLGAALTLGWSAAPQPPAAQAQASLGRIGEACARSLQVAREHLAAGETRAAGFPINWGPLPQADARQPSSAAAPSRPSETPIRPSPTSWPSP